MLKSIFVSSTFRDMQYERDTIQTKVVPAVNSVAAKYGESVSACDLRWGIDTSEMSEEGSAKKVLNVCLNEIDRCRPYMIVILGYRYGWIPGNGMISDAISDRDDFSLESDDISVTELEIEYGALFAAEHIDRTLFYFREIEGPCDAVYMPEDEKHREKLDCLKERIQSIPGSHVKTYRVGLDQRMEDCMDAFAAMVTGDICQLMRKEWEENAKLDTYGLDQKKQWAYLSEKNAQFISRTNLLKQCLEGLLNKKKLLLQGVSGSGKSTLTSRIGHELQLFGHQVVPIFCGYTPLCSSGFDILRYIIWELERILNIPDHFGQTVSENIGDPSVWYQYFDILVKRHNEEATQELTFIVDGIDQLIQDDIAKELSFIPRQDCAHIHFVLSTVSSGSILPGFAHITVDDLSPEERNQVIRGILLAKHRELAPSVIDKMSDRESSKLPLYLSLILQRLLMMNQKDFSNIVALGDGIDAITKYQLKLIEDCPSALDALSAHIIAHASNLVGGSMMTKAAKLIAVSRRGLRLSDLEGIMRNRNLKWSSVDAAAFIQYMGSAFLYRSDGRVDFAHKSIRQGFLAQCENVPGIHEEIAQWFMSLPDTDEVRQQEIVWHLISADMKHEFADITALMLSKKSNVSGITKDVVDAVVSDDAKWLIEVIKECYLDPSFMHLTELVSYHVFYGILNTAHNLEIKQKISEMILEATQNRCAIREVHGQSWDVSVSCDRLSKVHLAYGTKEHNEMAIKYSQHSLKVRHNLLEEFRLLDTPQKRREHLEEAMRLMNLGVTDAPEDSQIDLFCSAWINQLQRGICVACEDIAKVLETGDAKEKTEALNYLHASLRIRQEMYEIGKGESFAGSSADEVSELSNLYGRIAKIYLSLDGDENKQNAEKYYTISLEIVESSLEKGKTDLQLTTMCAAKIRLAEFYSEKGGEYIDQALELCLQCVPILEQIDIRQHAVDSKNNVAEIYIRLGSLYSKKDDPDSIAKAEMYYQKSRELIREIAAKYPSIEARRNLFIVNMNHDRLIRLDNERRPEYGEITQDTEDSVVAAYQEAQKLLKESGSAEAYEQLNEVYDRVIRMIQAIDDIDPKVRARVLTELDVCKMENLLKLLDRNEQGLEEIRDMVLRYADLSKGVADSTDLNEAILEDEHFSLLKKIEIPLERLVVERMERTYQLAKKAVEVSDFLYSKTESIEDLDMVAVSLSRYSVLCMGIAPEEWEETNERLFNVVTYLYKQTKRDKYKKMIDACLLERKLRVLFKPGEKTVSIPVKDTGRAESVISVPDAPPAPSESAILKMQIDQLEHKKEGLKGITNIAKRRNLQKQINELRLKLDALKESDT